MTTASTMSLKAAKKALRGQIKDRLAALDDKSVSLQSRKAQDTLLELPQYRAAESISVYLSMPHGEASTDLIVRDALNAGKAVYVPYIYKKADQSTRPSRVMDMLQLHSMEDFSSLQRDSWGIPTLPEDSIEQRSNALGGQGLALIDHSRVLPTADTRLDMIVVPGVAFDTSLGRIGHGAGYYDAFLSRYNANSSWKKPLLVGLCLAEQVLPAADAVPVSNLDWKVDMVVSGDGSVLPLR